MRNRIILPIVAALITEVIYIAAVIFIVGKVDIWANEAIDKRFLIALVGILIPIFAAGLASTFGD